jgi:glycosyltransferase involved in cell wall biosynthesis
MKICFVLEHFFPHVGGVETEFFEFSSRLVAMGCEVRVVTSDSGGVSGQSEYNRVAVWHHSWRDFFGHPYPRSADLIGHIAWADIVHTTTYTAAPVTLSVSQKFNKPCVLTVQECLGRRWFQLGENPLIAAGFFAFERFVIRRKFQAWHCISQATANDVSAAGIPQKGIVPILLGIDDSLYQSPPPMRNPAELFDVPTNSRVFLFFGRPGKTKGLPVLLDALKLIIEDIPADVIFGLILGAHPKRERQRFEEQIASSILKERVKVVPSVSRSELLGYVRGAYSVICPSITEGFGFSAAETSAIGTPIISSDAGSLPEVVSGEHLFFRSRSSTDLADKIRLAFRGEFNFRPKIEFSWEKATTRLLALYDELSPSKERRPS